VRRVFSSHDLIAAHHAKNLLVSCGICAEVRNERLASAMGELPPAECQAEVWVAEDSDVARAERLLREGVAVQGEPWTCPRCGERLEAQFTQCWKCGS
jgi:ribosomal protein S27AE